MLQYIIKSKETRSIGNVLKLLQQRSIRWRAVLYSIVLSTLIITFFSAISYLFILSLIRRDAIDVEVYDILQNVAVLGRAFLLTGAAFLALAIVLSFSFARRLTQPFLEIQRKVERLGPRHWAYKRTVHTGDEVEALDSVVADLTKRLQGLYTNLEGEVMERTQQLKHEYAKDRAILRSLVAGLIVVDQKGVIQEANPAAAELLQSERDKLVGQKILDVFRLQKHRKPLPVDEHPIHQCLRRRSAVHVDASVHIALLRKDGSALPIKLSAVPFHEGRRILGAVVLCQDVTVERQIDYMKTDFLHLASHHLRTPLSTLQWYLELLEDEYGRFMKGKEKSFLIEMQLAAKRMTTVVNELMDASRLGEGGIEPVMSEVDVVEEAQSSVQSAASFMVDHNVACIFRRPEQSMVVYSDPLLLGIIIQNILNNAVRYSKESGGKILMSFEKTKTAVRLHVQDEGIGIPRAEQERIFEKLFRTSNARKRQPSGVGLGLYSSRMIAEKMHASIRFVSQEGKGSTFTVVLPLVKKHAKRTTKKRP